MNCAVSAKKLQKAIVGQVTPKTPAGFRAVIIKFAIVLVISMFKKDTTLFIGVYHEDLTFAFCFSSCRIKTLFTNVCHADIHTDMPTHFLNKINFIILQHNLSVLFTTGAALTALMKNRPQSIFVNKLFHYFPALL